MMSEVVGADSQVEIEDTISQDPSNEAQDAKQEPEKSEPEQAEVEESIDPVELKKQRDSFKTKAERQRMALRDQQRLIQEMKAQLEQIQAQAKKPEDAAPKEDDYNTYEDFVKAQAVFEYEQKLKAQEAETKAKTQAEQQAKMMQERAKLEIEFTSAQASYIEQNPEYVANSQVVDKFIANVNKQSPAFAHFSKLALDVKNGGLDLINYLGANPREMIDLLSLNDFEAIERLDELADKAKGARAGGVKSPNLPKPPTKVTGPAKTGKSLESMSGEELLNWVRS